MNDSALVHRLSARSTWLLWGYLALVTLAELLTAISPRTTQMGLVLHAMILIAMLLHGAMERNDEVRKLVLALVLAPLIRLLSLSLPLDRFPQAVWHPLVSIPLLISMWLISRQLRVNRGELGLRRGNLLVQCMLIGGGLTLGALEYAILEPSSLLPSTSWQALGLVALSLFVFTGFTEEIIFRGLLQSLAIPVLGKGAILYVSLLFGVLHIGYLSVADVIFVTLVGLVFALVVYWGKTILGVTLSHGLTNVTLFLGLPLLLQQQGAVAGLVWTAVFAGTVFWVVAFGWLLWQAEIKGDLLPGDPEAPRRTIPIFGAPKAGFLGWLGGSTAGRNRVTPERRRLSPRAVVGFSLGAFFGLAASAGLLVISARGEPPTTPDQTGPQIAQALTPTAPAAVTPTSAVLVAKTDPGATAAPATTTGENPTPSATTGVVARLPWPEYVPNGMALTAADSWPFRVIAPDRVDEPFLIWRAEDRWLLLRAQDPGRPPPPRSARIQSLTVANAPATLIKYHGAGFSLSFLHGGRALQLSGVGVSDDELTRTVASLQSVSEETFQTRLRLAASDEQFPVTTLWPTYLPAGFTLVPTDSVVDIDSSTATTSTDGYQVSFQTADARIQIGAGRIAPPEVGGSEDRFTTGGVDARVNSEQGRLLLVIDATTSETFPPRFVETIPGIAPRLPLVQSGRVWVAAENVERAQFDRVVASLLPVRTQEFKARAAGQNTHTISYLWPTKLPAGYEVDLGTVRVAWDDFLLQGGSPFFEIEARNADGGTLTLKGGRESSGQAFIAPEGENVEQIFTNVHGQAASGTNSPDGTLLVWAENDTYYAIDSSSLNIEQLVAVGDGSQAIDAEEFYQNIQ